MSEKACVHLGWVEEARLLREEIKRLESEVKAGFAACSPIPIRREVSVWLADWGPDSKDAEPKLVGMFEEGSATRPPEEVEASRLPPAALPTPPP